MEANDTKKLWNRNFLLVILGRSVSDVGTHINTVALASFVLTHFDVAVYGTVMTMSTLPLVGFTVLGGAASDRFLKSKVMAMTDVLTGFVFVLLFLFGYLKWLNAGILYFIVMLSACLTGLFGPASLSIIPAVVKPKDIGRANSVAHLSSSAIRSAAPGLGGVLISCPSGKCAWRF